MPRKEHSDSHIPKNVWERKEKKIFNEARNFLYRKKKIEIEVVVEEEKNQIELVENLTDNSSDINANNNRDDNNGNSKDGNNNDNNDDDDDSKNKNIRTNHVDNDNHNDTTADTTTNTKLIIKSDNKLIIKPENKSTIKLDIIKSDNPINNDTTGGINKDNLSEIDLKWGAMVTSLDPNRDVLLFPSDGAVCASVFKWSGDNNDNYSGNDSNDNSNGNDDIGDTAGHDSTSTTTITPPHTTTATPIPTPTSTHKPVHTPCSRSGQRWRLVVLEASWQHGKTMHRQLTAYRQLKGLPPLRSVIINNVTGQYWRFHEEGKYKCIRSFHIYMCILQRI